MEGKETYRCLSSTRRFFFTPPSSTGAPAAGGAVDDAPAGVLTSGGPAPWPADDSPANVGAISLPSAPPSTLNVRLTTGDSTGTACARVGVGVAFDSAGLGGRDVEGPAAEWCDVDERFWTSAWTCLLCCCVWWTVPSSAGSKA